MLKEIHEIIKLTRSQESDIEIIIEDFCISDNLFFKSFLVNFVVHFLDSNAIFVSLVHFSCPITA